MSRNRDVMTRLKANIAALFAVAFLAPTAQADTIASLVTPTGVNVQTHLEAGNTLVIAVLPTNDVKLNGQLGIGLTPRDDQMIWLDYLPSVLMVKDDYFEGPVLQSLAFDAEYLTGPAVMGLTFGACLPDLGICILEEAEITLERADDGSVDLTLVAVEP